MEALEAIFTRHSKRFYTEQRIEDEKMDNILKAGMCGPSAANRKPLQYLVVRDKDVIAKMYEACGPASFPLKEADTVILICGDLERAFRPAPDYWIIDGGISAENICLAAHAQELGAVILGVWPMQERMDGLKALFSLPDAVIPHCLICLGYPAPDKKPPFTPPKKKEETRQLTDEERIHHDKW